MTAGSAVRYAQAPGVELRVVDDDAFLVAAPAGTIHHLNATGAAIWRQLAEPARFDDLLALLETAFPEVPRHRLASDLESLLKALAEENLITVTPAHGAAER